MRMTLKGINSKRKRLADGSFKTYYWAWKGGPPLRGEPGSPEFIASYNEAVATKIAPPTGVLLTLLFRFQESAEFQFGISPRTRRDYIKQIKRIERDFGDFPIKAIDDPSVARDLSRMARQVGANIIAAGRLCLWHAGAHFILGAQSRTDRNKSMRQGGKLYHGTRVHKIWHDEEVARFLRTAPPYLRLAMLLAINTGQRQGDLLRLPWSAYDGKHDQAASEKDRRLCPDPGLRRVEGCARCGTEAKPDHADQQRRQAVERKRISRRMGQGNHAGGNSRADVSRSARHRRGDAGAGRMQRGGDLFDHRPQAGRRAGDPDCALSAAGCRGRGQCDREIEPIQVARRSKGGRKSPNCAPNCAENREVKTEKA